MATKGTAKPGTTKKHKLWYFFYFAAVVSTSWTFYLTAIAHMLSHFVSAEMKFLNHTKVAYPSHN